MALGISLNQLLALTILTLLLATLDNVQSAPVSNEIPCQETVWPLSAHHATRYTYTASVSHFLSGAAPRATTRLNCDVKLSTTGECQHVMQVDNCVVKSDGGNKRQTNGNAYDVSSHELVFGLAENHTIQEIEADVNDSITSVNIKRGVLSLLQHALHRRVEGRISQRSVHGECDTQYSQESNNHVVMTADLNSCAHSSIHKLLPLVRLPDRSRIQEVLPVVSKKDCSIHLTSRQELDDVSCKETHLDTAAHTQARHRLVILQQLKLESVRRVPPSPPLDTSSYSPIDFLHQPPHYTPPRPAHKTTHPPTTAQIKRALTELYQVFDTKDGKPFESFKDLTSTAMLSPTDDLDDVLNSIVRCTLPSCTHSSKSSLLRLWFEVLLSCGTETCLQSAVYIVTSVPMSHSHRRPLWYTFTLTTGLNEDMMTALIGKCRQQPRDDCITSVSIILNKEDFNLSPVTAYISLLKEQLQARCSSTKATPNSPRHISVKSVLKALYNVEEKVTLYDRGQQTGDTVLSALHRCLQATDKGIVQMVIQNLHKPQYWGESRPLILSVLRDAERDLEVRVAALRSALQSGDESVADVVLDVWEQETSKQFKAYLTAYLNSLMEGQDNNIDSVPESLRLALVTRNLSLPTTPSQPQISTYGVVRSNLSGGESSTIEAHTLYYPGSLVPNSLNLQLNIQASGLTYNLADLVLQNEGFDFTSDIYGEEEQDGKYRHLSRVLSQALKNLQKQVASTYTLPYIEADFGLIGQLLGSTKVQDFSIWSALIHSNDFHSIWDMLNLDYIVAKLQNGLNVNWSKYSQMSLLEVSLPTGLGVPLTYTLDGALAFNAKADFLITSDSPIKSFLHLVEKTLKGNIALRSIVEVRSSMCVSSDGPQCSQSTVGQVWDKATSQAFSVSSTDSEISLSVPLTPTQQHSHYKLSAEVSDSRGAVEQVPVDLREKCFLSFLEELTGWDICREAEESNELALVRYLKNISSQLTQVLNTMLPAPLKQTLNSFIHRSLHLASGAYVFKVKFPTSSNNSLRPQHWLELLNAAWVRVRETSISVPTTYTATVYDAGTMVTFDGELYNFPGYKNDECTYVLARDYSSYKFTLLQSRDYMTAMLKEITVSLYKDGRVMVNNSGSFSDLPVFSWNKQVSVRREGSAIHLSTKYGINVLCNTQARYCTYTLTGWYHNRTLGLLGTNDNEASNDFKLKDGSITQSIPPFVNTYEITGAPGCRHRPDRRQTRAACSSPQQTRQLCKHLFERGDSPLAACFPFINPRQYKNMCLNKRSCSPVSSTTHHQSVCHISTVYSQMCSHKGIQVHPVPECIQCQTQTNNEANTKGVGETWTQPLHQKLDLVFVSSMHEDMAAEGVVVSSYFKHMVSSLQRHLGRENLVDIQMGLVGYDGEDMMEEPHAYTFNGSLFSDTQSLQPLHDKIASLTAQGTRSGQHSQALRLAAEYPFRTEAVKLVVWLSPAQQQKGDLTSVIEEYRNINLNLNVVEMNKNQLTEDQGEENSFFRRQLPLKIQITPQDYHHSINTVTRQIKDNVSTYIQQCQTCQCQVNEISLGQIFCQQTRCL